MMIEIPDDLAKDLSFALACYLEDTEKAFQKHKAPSVDLDRIRRNRHARLEKFRLLKLSPNALCGPHTLLSGETIRPGQEWTP